VSYHANRQSNDRGESIRQRHRSQGRRSHFLAQTFEERVPDLPFGGLRAVLDLGQKLRLDPDALVRDPLCEGLRLPNEWLESLAQVRAVRTGGHAEGGSCRRLAGQGRPDADRLGFFTLKRHQITPRNKRDSNWHKTIRSGTFPA
jgi:hypothetical protein